MLLTTAYTFGAEHGLHSESDAIKNMEIGWDLSNTSTVHRGHNIELFTNRRYLRPTSGLFRIGCLNFSRTKPKQSQNIYSDFRKRRLRKNSPEDLRNRRSFSFSADVPELEGDRTRTLMRVGIANDNCILIRSQFSENDCQIHNVLAIICCGNYRHASIGFKIGVIQCGPAF